MSNRGRVITWDENGNQQVYENREECPVSRSICLDEFGSIPYNPDNESTKWRMNWTNPPDRKGIISEEDLIAFGFENKINDHWTNKDIWSSDLEVITSFYDFLSEAEVEKVQPRYRFNTCTSQLTDSLYPNRYGYIRSVYEFIEFINNDKIEFPFKRKGEEPNDHEQIKKNKGIYERMQNGNVVNYNRGIFDRELLTRAFDEFYRAPRPNRDRRINIQIGEAGMREFNESLRRGFEQYQTHAERLNERLREQPVQLTLEQIQDQLCDLRLELNPGQLGIYNATGRIE